MKTQVRKNVFETNSSSIHAISISHNGAEGAQRIVKEMKGEPILVEGGQFGWEFDEYYDWSSKLSYAYTLATINYSYEEFLEKQQYIKDILESVGFVVEFQKMKKHEYEKSSWAGTEDDDEDIWIDHGSEWDGCFIEKLFSDKNFFLDFVFGNSCLYTGNDNSDWEKMDLGRMIDKYEHTSDFYTKWN